MSDQSLRPTSQDQAGPSRDDRLQAYLDGTLPRREAVELFLQAERDPQLRADLDTYRGLLRQLDQLPRVEAPVGFDAKIMASVPLEYYRSLPARPQPVLAIGQPSASTRRRLVTLRSWVSAASVAYVLFLLVSHSWLARGARAAGAAFDGALADLAARSRGVPVLAGLLTGLRRIYEIGLGAVSALSATLGSTGATLAIGVALLLLVLAIIGLRRREDPTRSHV